MRTAFLYTLAVVLFPALAFAQAAPAAAAPVDNVPLISLIVAIGSGALAGLSSLLLVVNKSTAAHQAEMLRGEIKRIDDLLVLREKLFNIELARVQDQVTRVDGVVQGCQTMIHTLENNCRDMASRGDGWDKTFAELATDLHALQDEHEVEMRRCKTPHGDR